MIFTWYFIAPLGIFLALFYKEAFPNGLWFYVSVDRFQQSVKTERVRT